MFFKQNATILYSVRSTRTTKRHFKGKPLMYDKLFDDNESVLDATSESVRAA